MQGFNMGRYHDPALLDQGVTKFNRTPQTPPTVRFELPFAVWCTSCKPEALIAQGVRFNALKKKVGDYFTTPIWGFRFKHGACGAWIEVRTDPARTEYVVVEGARRRDYGAHRDYWGEEVGVRAEEKKEDGAFAGLERRVGEKEAKSEQERRIDELKKRSLRDWADPYERNRRVRTEFRVGRRRRQDDARTGRMLEDKFGLGLDVLPEGEGDSRKASLTDFGGVQEGRNGTRGIFDAADIDPAETESTKRADKKFSLQMNLRQSTRAKTDPFLRDGRQWGPVVKHRPKSREEHANGDEKEDADVAARSALVGYDSD